MKILFMGSIPTYPRPERRELSEQEKPFARACEELGYVAAAGGHVILASDDHPASVDFHVIRGVLRYVAEGPDRKAEIQVHRAEGSALVYDALPSQVKVTRKFHPDFDRMLKGTLIPNLAALESANILVLLGGGLTVKLMGQIGADKERPVLAIPSFGGTAVEVFESLKWIYRGVLGDRFNELTVLKSTWGADSAVRVIGLAEALALRTSTAAAHSYFLSYTWGDSSITDHVEVMLHRYKRAVNRDESIFSAGADLSDVVRSLINESDTFLALWSAAYKQSTWCPQELEYALNRQAKNLKPSRVVLVMLDETEPPIRFTNKLRKNGQDRPNRELTIRQLVEQEV